MISKKPIKRQILPKPEAPWQFHSIKPVSISQKRKLWQSIDSKTPYLKILVRDAKRYAVPVSRNIDPKKTLYLKDSNVIFVTGTNIALWTDPNTRKTYIFNKRK